MKEEVEYSQKDLDRFLSKINKTDGCWIWTATGNQPYGKFSIGSINDILAHRFSYYIHVGKIEKGLHLDHLCRNTRCVNPEHLEPVTPKENYRRGIGCPAINKRKTHCPKGHEYTEENTFIRKSGRRRCIACTNEKQKRKYWENKNNKSFNN